MNNNTYLTLSGLIMVVIFGVYKTAFADVVTNDDVITKGSMCVGLDCTEDMDFLFSTIVIKENNAQILFEDSSGTGSFPTKDWLLQANETTNGGRDFFAIKDVEADKFVFTVEAGAPENALIVNTNGNVGISEGSPEKQLHITTGNTATIRLEQDDSNGFGAQVFDIGSNESNFFVRDATANKLPFRIVSGAPDSAMWVDSGGNLAFNVDTSQADGSLHVRRTGVDSATLLLEQTQSNVKWEMKAHAGTGRLTFKDLNSNTTPFKLDATSNSNLLTVGVEGNNVVNIRGDLVISGNCSEADGSCADYVFADDYELRDLDNLATFIKVNKHLPNVPSADSMEKNGVSVAHISGRLLEKIEELTLYTLQQQETITQLNKRLQSLEEAAYTSE